MLGTLGLLDGITLDAVGFPRPGLVGAERTRNDAHLLAHHEGGVEAHAELADDIDVSGLVLGVLRLELEGIGMRDGAQVAVEVVFAHADAVIGHRDRARVGIERDGDGQIRAVNLQSLIGQAAEIELVDRVGRVGDKLAQKDLAIGVDRVDHEVEQLLALCLELSHSGAFLLSCYVVPTALAVRTFEC